MFLTIILTIKDRDDIALVDLVDEVANNELLRYIDENRSHATQLVFSAFGWITMLYDPSLNPEKNSLQILCPPSSNPRTSKLSLIQRRSRHKSQTFSNLRQDLELSDQPFPSLLTVFGNILPEANVSGIGGHTGRFLHMSRWEDTIQPSNLCFYNLHKLLNVNIHWVDCLSQHLEFDSHAKVLKLFRYPSLCLVMSYNEKSCLSRLFSDYADSKGFAVHGKDDAGDYFKEIILSYCLMFGQQKSNLGGSVVTETIWNSPGERDPDPLLDILCRPNWDGDDLANFLDEIDATIPMDDFSATKVFKFHGPRLLIIQRAIQSYQPDGIGSLWHDTRDAYKWWTLWAVLAMGGIAIILGLIQVVLQACQLYFTIRPI
ncbi:hypothetical protein IFR05_002679 [Cadophora sp. M221]|nr:hypothetical protein IFR05_002679 [Cadophora sp. M221]